MPREELSRAITTEAMHGFTWRVLPHYRGYAWMRIIEAPI
jgi:hypothetical protein